jgi:hypothetical protein
MRDARVRTLTGAQAREVQALADLHPAHYREALAVAVDHDRRPEEWARLILEGATPAKRAALLRTWRLIGVRLAPLDAPGQVLGWRIRRSGPDGIVLAVTSRSGLSARLVVTATPRRVVQAMVVRFDRWFARPLWRVLTPQHRRFIAGLLSDAASRQGRGAS